MSTVIRACSCSTSPNGNPNAARFQDGMHGRGMRVMNVGADGKGCSCTVCGSKRVV